MALPDAPATPALVVDVDVLDRNLEAMADLARRSDVRLRPHVKTHKCLEIAERQVRAGADGLTVATVAEAEVFAAAGFDDLFIAYPLWVDRDKGARIHRLLQSVRLDMGVDSAEGGRALAAQLGADRGRAGVLIEVDSGHHRTGVPPDTAGRLADQLRHEGLDVRGVFTFPGHSYGPGMPQTAARDEATTLSAAAEALRSVGIEPRVVSGGSTPSVRFADPGTVTEIRPGVYPFGDAQQLELGTCEPGDIALTALATVVSRSNGHVVLDSGSKMIGADRPAWTTGHGRLLDHLDARIIAISEHHATVRWDDSPVPSPGDRLRVLPNHVCNAVNLVDELVIVQDGRFVDRWRVAARGANT